ncbi:MAG TPA: hypothetical protein VHA82_11765 [Ramlibacter sp.]|uniref:hypothetical protein n=1 Tax=Ramlibacter sp. TaxID=1917967 RepID=UPI002CDE5718|nr:hypothetical protein [Ramlibacter sp.]HVZ44478.1 hypothetical protein [Ramlibacter sp.]
MPHEHADTPPFEYQLSCAEALIAGTLALMTSHVQAQRAADRAPMARKIVANLDELAAHVCISPQFREVVHLLRDHWQAMHRHSLPKPPAPEPRAKPAAPGRLH